MHEDRVLDECPCLSVHDERDRLVCSQGVVTHHVGRPGHEVHGYAVDRRRVDAWIGDGKRDGRVRLA